MPHLSTKKTNKWISYLTRTGAPDGMKLGTGNQRSCLQRAASSEGSNVSEMTKGGCEESNPLLC